MIFTMSGNQPLHKLKEADEIKIKYKNLSRLDTFMTIEEQSFFSKPIILHIESDDSSLNWEKLKFYKQTFQIIFTVDDLNIIPILKDQGFDMYYWSQPVSDYWTLNTLKNLNVYEVILDSPLYFDLIRIHDKYPDLYIKLFANKCYYKNIPYKNGIIGTYVRPEDIITYEPYVQFLEFITDTLEQELTLIKIYKAGVWPGNLNLLLTNLNYNIDNRGIDEEFGKKRISCKQQCQISGLCHFCEATFNLVNTIQRKSDWILKKQEKT